MDYKISELKYFENIFNTGLDLAKIGDKTECEEFFRQYIDYIVSETGITVEEATERAKSNFGYFAGYFSEEIRKLIEDTYEAMHPIFGSVDNHVTPDQAYQLGLEMGKKHKDNIDEGSPLPYDYDYNTYGIDFGQLK